MEFRNSTYTDTGLLIFLSLSILLNGCDQSYQAEPLIHPHPEGKPFQECSIDLSAYKPIQLRAAQDPDIVLAVAASGGGYRAANFTAGALLGLEELTNDSWPGRSALAEVDYFSTVSGGGFAVGAYMSSIHDYRYFKGDTAGYSFANALQTPNCDCPFNGRPQPQQLIDPCIRNHLRGLRSDFIKDFLRALLPWDELGLSKRGLRFERLIDDEVLGYRWRKKKLESLPAADIFVPPYMGRSASLTLADIFVAADDPQKRPVLPFWVANATVYDSGAIFVFTPDQLELYRIDGYNHRLAGCTYSPSEQNYNEFVWAMPVSVAVASSGNFPFALPPNMLTNKLDPNNPYIRLLDGGMADNLGVYTALRLLDADTSPSAQGSQPLGPSPRKALIVIDAYQGPLAPFSASDEAPSVGETVVRAIHIPLDSWRWRYREFVDGLCEPKNIKTIYISFDDLLDTDFNDLCEFGLSEEDTRQLCREAPASCPEPTPFNLLRSISMAAPATKGEQGWQYRLSPAQQNLLIAAGRYVVHKKKDQILFALKHE